MSKRFTDTEKWKKPFIRSLKAPYKLLWLYILDECDHAGVWQVDLDVAQIKIGEKLDYKTALKYLEAKVIPFDNHEKWFIPDFIDFQYGQLNPENRAHNSVIQILQKYSLLGKEIKPLTSPLEGAMDMDKDMDKDIESSITIDIPTIVREAKPKKPKFEAPSLEEVTLYFVENGYTEEAAKKAFDYYEANQWHDSRNKKVSNWKQKMISVWFKDQYKQPLENKKSVYDFI